MPAMAVAVCAKPSEFEKRTPSPTATLATNGAKPAAAPADVEPAASFVRSASMVTTCAIPRAPPAAVVAKEPGVHAAVHRSEQTASNLFIYRSVRYRHERMLKLSLLSPATRATASAPERRPTGVHRFFRLVSYATRMRCDDGRSEATSRVRRGGGRKNRYSRGVLPSRNDVRIDERARSLVARWLVATAFTIGCGVLPLAARADDPRTIPLVNQRGATFRLADLHGRPAVLTFIATRCTDACPIANVAFHRLAQRLRRDGIDARLLTITLDPDYDTPFVLAHVAQSFGAAPYDWTFASGRPEDVRRLLRSFGVVAQKDRRGVPDLHTSFVYVLDRRVRLAKTLLLSTGLTQDAERAIIEGNVASR